jgi:hypothetical protein
MGNAREKEAGTGGEKAPRNDDLPQKTTHDL